MKKIILVTEFEPPPAVKDHPFEFFFKIFITYFVIFKHDTIKNSFSIRVCLFAL